MSSKANIHSDDYYQVLGLGKEASDAEIAKAYKKLALKHHPDKNPDRKEKAEEEFKTLTEAYDVLRCAEKRKIYDQYGKAGLNGNGGGNPQSGEPGFSFGGGRVPGQANISREEADMIFRAFFGGADPFGGASSGGGGGGTHFVFTSGDPSNGAGPFGGFEGVNFGGMNFAGGFPGAAGSHPSRARSAAGQRSSKRLRSRRSTLVPNGAEVAIQGLVTSPEHNGKFGNVVSWDDDKARYEVQLRSGDEDPRLGNGRLWLRPQNITQVCLVEITGLTSMPELNGKRGVIQSYDQNKRRYMVLMDDSDASFALTPANCVLSPGTSITMNGLSSAEYNGQGAQILSVDRAAARYAVACRDGKQIKIKFQNVVC